MIEFGPWTTLSALQEGAVFQTQNTRIFAVKSEYTYSNDGQCLCVLLESGEYAHFPNGNNETVRELLMKGIG